MKKTKIINFIAGAGAGKSTMCAGVFSKLKMNGVDCELSSEYAKELVWESRNIDINEVKNSFMGLNDKKIIDKVNEIKIKLMQDDYKR